MKKKFTFLIAAVMLLTMMVLPGKAVGQASLNQVMWSEDFSGYDSGDVPSGEISNSHDGTTVYNNGSVTYTCNNGTGGGTTKVYNDNTPSGGSGNNLLIAKSNGYFEISGIPTGDAIELAVTYASGGQGTLSISSSTSGVSVSNGKIITGGASSITIKFQNTASKNLRIDNIQIKVSKVKLPAPTNLSATAGNGQATFAWDAVSNASSYTLSYTTDSEWGSQNDETGITGTSKALTPLENGTTYYVKVKAVGNGTTYTDSDYTAVQSVTPTAETYYTVSIDGEITGGTVTASPASATPGTTIVLLATPDDCYTFGSYTVTSGVTVTENSFTMPSNDVTVSATFNQKKFTVNYSVNGTVYEALKQTNVTCGSSVTLKDSDDLTAASITLPDGYTYYGWSTSPTSTTTISELTASDNITLYAVMSHTETGEPVTSYQKVTSSLDDWSGVYLIVNEDDSKVLNSGASDIAAAAAAVDIVISDSKIESNATINSYSFTVASYSGGYSFKTTTNKYMGRTSGTSSGTNPLSNSEVKNTIAYNNGDITISTSNSGSKTNYYLRYNNNNTTVFRYYTSASSNPIQFYKKVTTTPSTTTYCTRVCTKSISQFTSAGNGWHLIASPVATTPDSVTNMLSNTYDLYRFNQSAADCWENYKNEAHQSGFTITPGKGYLYANSENVTLTFAGVPYTGDGSFALVYGNTKNLNLVGNPYDVAVTVDKAFYVMNSMGSEIIAAADVPQTTVAPMEGIFVIAESADDQVTFSKPDANAAPNNNPSLVMNLTQNRGGVIDRAVVRFEERESLPKFQLFENSTKISLVKEDEEYAIVSAEARGEMSVCFKAAQDGQYTITVNPQEVEMGYLHLIDNIAGTDIDLLANPSYTFNAKSDDYESRFRLVFSANNENQNENEKDFAFFSNGQLIVTSEGTLQVVDMMGRVISTEVVNGTSSKAINAKAGVYVLRLMNGENVKTQKIVVR